MTEEEKVAESALDIEASLPENTPENPQPTLFSVSKNDLYEHTQYTRSFPKNTDIKAPVVTDFQDMEKLNEMQDEYLYTKTDTRGEQKISKNGYLLGGRKYIITTFTLPGRGKKLYVLGTEAAKFLNHRDAFVLFNRFKNLYKLKTSEEERLFLEKCNFSVSKSRSRSVAVTTAKNLFMIFGARIVKNGKRVEDDYWEEAAIEQGFKVTDQVFPLEKGRTEPAKPKPVVKPVPKVIKTNLVNPLPPLEDRKDYLLASSSGIPSQVLPGQGIAGGIELATVATIPKYKQDNSGATKHRSLLSSLSTNSSSTSLAPQATSNQIPINDRSVGEKSTGGLPYYSSNVLKRVQSEDPEKIKEIEYLHGTVETNNYITLSRKPRIKQWQYYWQVKAGVPIGLLEKQKEEFIKEKEENLNKVHEETIYNEFLYCDQVIKRRKKPNPNYLGHGNIKGLKPPYIEQPTVDPPAASQLPPHIAQQGQIPVQHLPLQGRTPVVQPPYQQYQANSGYIPVQRPTQPGVVAGIPQHMYNDQRVNQFH